MPSEAEYSTELPPSGVSAQSEADAELAAMLAQSAASNGLEWTPLPFPEHSRLDNWFLGSELDGFISPRSA